MNDIEWLQTQLTRYTYRSKEWFKRDGKIIDDPHTLKI